MQIDATFFPPAVSEIEAEGGRSARLDPVSAATVENNTADPAVLSSPAAVPWMDPGLGGWTALGGAEHYLPVLQSLYEELSQRQDSVARFGSAAIMEELHNHAILNGQINSLIA